VGFLFVRAKHQGDRTYYYLVESYRDGGKVRHRTLAYLMKYATVEQALTELPRRIELRRLRLSEHWSERSALRLRQYEVLLEKLQAVKQAA